MVIYYLFWLFIILATCIALAFFGGRFYDMTRSTGAFIFGAVLLSVVLLVFDLVSYAICGTYAGYAYLPFSRLTAFANPFLWENFGNRAIFIIDPLGIVLCGLICVALSKLFPTWWKSLKTVAPG